jgi:glutaryl-CoA dehydrogenase
MLEDKDFQWEDPLDLEGELTEDERMVRDTARAPTYCIGTQ